MATSSGWDLGHVVTIVGAAAVGAAVAPVAVPALVGAVGLSAVAGALGFTSISAGAGAVLGGWLGHKASAPS